MTLITMYVYARKKQVAMKIFENVFHKITSQILKMKIITCEPYWKIDGQYHICVEIEFKNEFLYSEKFDEFLMTISNHWKKAGENLIAAQYIDGCTNMPQDIYFVYITRTI